MIIECEWNEVEEGNMPHEKGMMMSFVDGVLTKMPEEDLMCIIFECLVTIAHKDDPDKEVLQCYWSAKSGWLRPSHEPLELDDGWEVTHWMRTPEPAEPNDGYENT